MANLSGRASKIWKKPEKKMSIVGREFLDITPLEVSIVSLGIKVLKVVSYPYTVHVHVAVFRSLLG